MSLKNFIPGTTGLKPVGVYRDRKSGKTFRRYTKRNKKITKLVLHHAAGKDAALLAAMLNPNRTLSANYVMLNNNKWYGIVADMFKANTTAHAVDHEALTIEIANNGGEKGSGNPDSWSMTPAKMEAIAQFVAAACKHHGLPINRKTVTFHREYKSTRCPGEFLWNRRDWIVKRAQEIAKGPTPAPARPTPAPAPRPTPTKPAPKPSPKQVVIGSKIKLATPWKAYRYGDPLRGEIGDLDAGIYTVKGILNGNLKLSNGKTSGWVHRSAQAGLQKEK